MIINKQISINALINNFFFLNSMSPGNNRSTWRYGHYAETFRHMPIPICLHI